jgi:hypothetical protein
LVVADVEAEAEDAEDVAVEIETTAPREGVEDLAEE